MGIGEFKAGRNPVTKYQPMRGVVDNITSHIMQLKPEISASLMAHYLARARTFLYPIIVMIKIFHEGERKIACKENYFFSA